MILPDFQTVQEVIGLSGTKIIFVEVFLVASFLLTPHNECLPCPCTVLITASVNLAD